MFDPVPGYRARAVHGVHRTVAVTRPWGGRGADVSRVRALLPPGLRARGFTKRAEVRAFPIHHIPPTDCPYKTDMYIFYNQGVSRTHVPKLPVFLDARAVREAFGTKETTPGEAHAERARAHHGFGGKRTVEKRDGCRRDTPPTPLFGTCFLLFLFSLTAFDLLHSDASLTPHYHTPSHQNPKEYMKSKNWRVPSRNAVGSSDAQRALAGLIIPSRKDFADEFGEAA